jgi:hypothetical protein
MTNLPAVFLFQFIGHALEGKPPEFFHDWRRNISKDFSLEN